MPRNFSFKNSNNLKVNVKKSNLFNQSGGSFQSDLNSETIDNLKSVPDLGNRQALVVREELFSQKANRNLQVLMRSLPPTSLQKNFSAIENASLQLQDAGVDLPQLAMNLRRLDRTRMLFRSLQSVLQKETSAAFSRILQVKLRRSRALENVSSRLKARLLMDISGRIQVEKTSQRYFYKWFLKSNPELLRRVTCQILLKQKLSHKVACWRLAYLVRVHKPEDKKQDLLWIMRGIMKMQSLIQNKHVLYTKEAVDRMSPRYHNKAFQILKDIIQGYQDRRSKNLRRTMGRFKKMTSRVQKLFKILEIKGKSKVDCAFNRLRNWRSRILAKEGEANSKLKERRREEVVSLCIKRRLEADRRAVLRALLKNLNDYRQKRDRQQQAVNKLQKIIEKNISQKLKAGLEKFKKKAQNERNRESVVKSLKRNFDLKVESAIQKFDFFQQKEADNEREEVKGKRVMFRNLGTKTDDKRWKALWRLRIFGKTQGNNTFVRTLKKKRNFNRLLMSGNNILREALNRLRDNNLRTEHVQVQQLGQKKSMNFVIKRKFAQNLKNALDKLRDFRREEVNEMEQMKLNGNRLARLLIHKSSIFKMNALRKLRNWNRQKENQGRSGLRLILKLNLHKGNSLRKALEKLRSLNRQQDLKGKMEGHENDLQEVKSNFSIRRMIRNLLRSQSDRRAIALERLRNHTRDSEDFEKTQKAKIQRPLGWVVERLLGKKAIAFYKLLRCFGDGDQAFRKRREEIKLGVQDTEEGWLGEEAKKAFANKIKELMGKQPIGNVVVEAVERYVDRKEIGGDMEGVKTVLEGKVGQDHDQERMLNSGAGNITPSANENMRQMFNQMKAGNQNTTAAGAQDPSQVPKIGVIGLIEGLKQSVRAGDPQAQHILAKINNRDKMRIKDLELFMNDRNHSGPYSKLIEFFEETPDLTLYEVSKIVKKNFNKRPKLWSLKEEVDEASDKEKLLKYLERNNIEGKFNDIIREGRAPNARYSEILEKLDGGNRGGAFEEALDYINKNDVRVRDKLVRFVMEMDGKTGGVFKPVLKQVGAHPDLGVAQIYERAKEALDQAKANSQQNPSNKRLITIVSEKMRDLVNEGGEKRVNRGMDYISHCNKVQKGRFNDLVKFSNERQGEGEEEDDELAEEDIFDWVQQKWGLELDQLYSLADVKGETNPELATQRRDLVRGIEDSDRKKRWEMYLTERPRWEKGQEMLRELGRVRAWKLSDLLEKVIKKGDQLASAEKEDQDLTRLTELLNWSGRKRELENYLVDSNENGRNQPILEFIQNNDPEQLRYLDILNEVFNSNGKGWNKHILDFINKETGLNFEREVLRNIQVRGDVGLVKEVEANLGRQERDRPKVVKILRQMLEQKEGQLSQAGNEGIDPNQKHLSNLEKQIEILENVMGDLEGRNQEHGLMDKIENYMRIRGRGGEFKELKALLEERVAKREEELGEEEGEEQIPELEDLIEVMNQNPRLREKFGDIERLLGEKEKSPKFEKMLEYLKENNTNGKYFPLLKELDYKRLLEKRERAIKKNNSKRGGGKETILTISAPELMDMARILRAKAKGQPNRFQKALDYFDGIDEMTAAQKIGNYMRWTKVNPEQNESQNGEDTGESENNQENNQNFEGLIKRLVGEPKMNLTQALEEIQEEDEDGLLESVWNRINEETLGNDKLLDFMRKTPEDEDTYANVIRFIDTNGGKSQGQSGSVGLIEILDEIRREEENEPGKMQKLIGFIDTGGVDIDELNLDKSDPLFEFLERSRALNTNPGLFQKLQNGLLNDPEELLRDLKRNQEAGGEGQFNNEELIRQLEAYNKRHREYPDYGENNKKHVFFRVVANYLRPYYRKLARFGRERGQADRMFTILLRKNHDLKKLKALKNLQERRANLMIQQERELGFVNRKNSNLKSIMAKMYGSNMRSAFLRLRGHKTSDKYRKAVTKGYKEKFWGILIRCINPGIYKAFNRLRRFKDERIVQEANQKRKTRKFILKLREGNNMKLRTILTRLQMFSHRDEALERIRNRMNTGLIGNWRSRLREALWKLSENRNEGEREEDEMEDTVKMVFARAGHRTQMRQVQALKDLQIRGVQRRLINQNVLQRIFGNAARNEQDLKREALRELREFQRENQDTERKFRAWSRIGGHFTSLAKLRVLNALREYVKKENIKMSMNSLFKWKAANMHAKSETMREMQSLVSLYKGALIGRMEKSRLSLMRDALNRLRLFLNQNKGHVGHMVRKLIHVTTLKKTRAFHALRNLNRAFNLENNTADKMMGRLLRCLEERRLVALNKLRAHAAVQKLRNRLSTTIITQYVDRSNVKTTALAKQKLGTNARKVRQQRAKLDKILKNMSLKDKRERFMKWRDLIRQELICRFNSKITSLCLSLRKNHRFEARNALEKWSQKKQKLKYQKLAAFLESAKGLQKRETYTHMKIHHMQKKLSSMCKIWGRLLDFVETRKKENIMYAFDAMSLDNPWADRVPQLLACGKVMSAQMCFWKLRLTRKTLLKKRRQRATNYKIDKVKLVFLESIFTKKLSQYFMNIQLAKRNKYL